MADTQDDAREPSNVEHPDRADGQRGEARPSDTGRRDPGGAAFVPNLVTLTPQFDADQHQMYVDLLSSAVSDGNQHKIHNIALTGRYGGGKSSILEQFSSNLGDRVLKLSLSTLGPRAAGETLTNQIEMELVKRLLHSRPANALPRSRFQRIQHPAWWRSAGWSVAQVAVLGVLLWIFGWFPHIAGFGGGHSRGVQIGALVLVTLVLAGALTWAKRVIGDQVISSVGTAGAQVTFAQKGVSFFDEHLAEIVYFFERVKVDIVVFEDLDRFDDRHIFEELRELNVLLNSPKLIRGRSIRFVYALKDSIFEQLGDPQHVNGAASEHDDALPDTSGQDPVRRDTRQTKRDAAEAEAERANRTKFFDVVVPVVPFITHRNSRDLFMQTLDDPTLLAVSTDLIDVTARHITDMRLLKNIRNEYAVFAARLITNRRGMPDLGADHLFAMIVYKNIHPADFEKIQIGDSALDRLYNLSRDLVREAIIARRRRLRAIDNATAVAHGIETRAGNLGSRLTWFIEILASFAHARQPAVLVSCAVGAESFDDLSSAAFWRAVLADGNGVTANVRVTQPYNNNALVSIQLSKADLETMIRDELLLEDWDARDARARSAERDQLQREIGVLSRGDFASLAANTDFTLGTDSGARSFADIVHAELDSTVTRELVRSGYIDQNFALHVAQYYTDRVSMEAMNFIVRHAQPNLPDFYYPFPSPTDVESVLREREREAGPAFLDQEWPYNVAIVDYLIFNDKPKAWTVLDRVTRVLGEAERAFLAMYLDGGAEAPRAVELLARRWSRIFRELVETAELPEGRRVELVNAALQSTDPSIDYDLSDAVSAFLTGHYAEFDCLTTQTSGELDSETLQQIISTLGLAGFVCENLEVLHPSVRRLIVTANRYPLTSANLLVALYGTPTERIGTSTVLPHAALSLDTVRNRDRGVFDYCVSEPGLYLAAAVDDPETQWTVADPATFVDIVADVAHWPGEHLNRALSLASPDCAITDLTTAPDVIWPALAATKRFPATQFNVAVYLSEHEVDAALAIVLRAAGTIDVEVGASQFPPNAASPERVVASLVNAANHLPDPRLRVGLAASIDLEDWLDPAEVEPERGPLLSLLIEHQVCEASAALFERFAPLDWETLEPAIRQSNDFASFMTPQIVGENLVADLLNASDLDVPEKIKRELVIRLAEFTPDSDPGALQSAGRYALAANTVLDFVEIAHIAEATRLPAVVVPLVARSLRSQNGEGVDSATVLASLVPLGGKYAELATSQRKPKFPDDPDHDVLMTQLKRDRLLTFRRIRGKLHVTVI